MKSKRPIAKKLEELRKIAVKTRAGFTCEYHRGIRAFNRKPCDGYLHAHHISGKRSIFQKTALENGVALCAGAHLYIAHEDGGCGTRAAELKRWAAGVREVSIEHLESLGNVLNSDKFEIKEQLEDAIRMYEQQEPVIIGAKPKRR